MNIEQSARSIHRPEREESRPGVMGGGMLLAVNNFVQSTHIRDMEPSGYDVSVCDAKPQGKKRFAIFVAYRPPTTNVEDFFNISEETMIEVLSNYSLCLVTSDFNMSGIDWSCPAPKYPRYVNNFLLVNKVYSNKHNHI